MTNNKTALVSIKAVLLITNGGASLPTLQAQQTRFIGSVLIPDLWGESSDNAMRVNCLPTPVLIPDLWGESSDQGQEDLGAARWS